MKEKLYKLMVEWRIRSSSSIIDTGRQNGYSLDRDKCTPSKIVLSNGVISIDWTNGLFIDRIIRLNDNIRECFGI